MPTAVAAIDYLHAPAEHPPRAVCVLFGEEPFLKRHSLLRLRAAALGGEDAELSVASFPGQAAAWRDVHDELSTLAMFGGTRFVVVDDADEFVTRHRPQLEDYVAKPKPSGVLVLDVRSWPANTRLAKAVAASGLAIECNSPTGARLAKWLVAWARQAHHAQLTSAAADMLVEMVGPEVGLLDQEIAKLAVSVGATGKIEPALVEQMVGSWRAKTAWEMLDAALDGNIARALTQLDRLLLAGENAVAVLAQISASLRRLAAATRLIVLGEAQARRMPLRDALQQAGVKAFVLAKAEQQLRRLGRQRGEQLYQWLLQADMDLKGFSELPTRTILERLLVRIGGPAPAAKATK